MISDQKPVGLLWDSVSNNTGDKSMGLVMRRFCERSGIDYEVLNPFSYDPTRYSTIIVGGGEIVRKLGNPFFDCFKVEGPHILNAMGCYLPDNLDYLRDYLLVTVRSEADKQMLQDTIPNTKVRPCVATLLGEFYPKQEASGKSVLPPSTRPNIGVHLHWGTLESVPDVLDGLREINRKYHITFVPFTLYNNDHLIFLKLAALLPDASVSAAREPVDIYHSISALDGMIVSSLHAMIFSMMQNVPVVAFPYTPKMDQHLVDRGLSNWVFHTVPEMVEIVLSSEFLKLDYGKLIEEDRRSAHDHLEEIKRLVGTGRQREAGTPRSRPPLIDHEAQVRTYYDTLWAYLPKVGGLWAELVESRALLADQRQQLQVIQRSTGWRLLEFLRGVRLWFFPRGSSRENAWYVLLGGLGARRAERSNALVGRIRNHRGGKEQGTVPASDRSGGPT